MSAETAAYTREWVASLLLSDTEAADALHLGNRDSIIREYMRDRREPAPPTLHLMRMTSGVAHALFLLRTGQAAQACAELETLLTPATRANIMGGVDWTKLRDLK